jgi:hypothetical protein
MALAGPTNGKLDFGRVVNRTFAALGANFLLFIGLFALLILVPAGIIGAIAFGLYTAGLFDQSALQAGGYWVIFLAFPAYLVFIAASLTFQAAMIHGVVAWLNDRRASFGECLSTGFSRWLGVFGVGLVAGIGIVFGYILLIVPGVLMSLAWCVAVPVQVVERRGVFGSLSRSADLTRNRRGVIFGLFLVYSVGLQIVLQIVQTIGAVGSPPITVAPSAVFTAPAFLMSMALSLGVNLLGVLVSSTGTAVIYTELRATREGVSPADLASVFD